MLKNQLPKSLVIHCSPLWIYQDWPSENRFMMRSPFRATFWITSMLVLAFMINWCQFKFLSSMLTTIPLSSTWSNVGIMWPGLILAYLTGVRPRPSGCYKMGPLRRLESPDSRTLVALRYNVRFSIFKILFLVCFLTMKKRKTWLPAVHRQDGHQTANFGSKGDRTQACASLRGKPCKFVIAINYCTTPGYCQAQP